MQATTVTQTTHSSPSPVRAETFLSGLILSIIFMSLLLALESEAATYYTKKTGSDSNSCVTAQNEATPKLTINAGKNCLSSPGDTLIVGNGTYVENEISMSVSGTVNNPITIRAQNLQQAILSSTSGNSCGPNISFHASYITIDGLRGEINAADPVCAINSATGAFVRMWEAVIPSIGGSQTTGNVGGVVRNCLIDASSHRGVGIKTNQDNSLIENCVVHSSLEGLNGLNQVFRNNLIDGVDFWGDQFTSKGGARNTQFYNNVIRRTSGYRGIVLGGNTGSAFFWDSSSGIECYNCVAYNNVLIIQNGSGPSALDLRACSNCAAFNNVILNGSLSLEAGSLNPIVKNNIFSCGGQAAHGGISFTGTFTEDYNDFFNCSGTPSQAHAVVGDPLFVSPASDWHLQASSPALGSGLQASFTGYNSSGAIDVSKDKVGVVRTVPWSLGVYAGDGSASADTTPPAVPAGLTLLR